MAVVPNKSTNKSTGARRVSWSNPETTTILALCGEQKVQDALRRNQRNTDRGITQVGQVEYVPWVQKITGEQKNGAKWLFQMHSLICSPQKPDENQPGERKRWQQGLQFQQGRAEELRGGAFFPLVQGTKCPCYTSEYRYIWGGMAAWGYQRTAVECRTKAKTMCLEYKLMVT